MFWSLGIQLKWRYSSSLWDELFYGVSIYMRFIVMATLWLVLFSSRNFTPHQFKLSAVLHGLHLFGQFQNRTLPKR